MKTVKDWLEELPDGYRERALVNLPAHNADKIVDSMHTAIRKLKYWSETKEGYTWWQCVEEHYRKETHMKYWQPALPLLPMPTRRELIEKRIEEVEVVRAECQKQYNDLGQREMLSGSGATLQKQINQCIGEVIALKWVLGNIDLD